MSQLAHKTALTPNNKQRTYFFKASGIARKCWNWGLANWNSYYQFNLALPKEDRERISGLMLKKEFNAIKREEFPYMYEVTKYASQQPFIHLQAAFNRFFQGLSKYPRFKSRNNGDYSFYIGGDQVKIQGRKIWVPNLGWVRMKEKLRFNGKINSVTISMRGGRWFVSVQVEVAENLLKNNLSGTIGVDLGIKQLATFSNGLVIDALSPLKEKLRQLAHLQRVLARKVKGSKNYYKHKLKIARLHKKIADLRRDVLHKITSSLTATKANIVIEDLNVSGMLKNHKLARAISDVGMGEFRRQLEYKTKLYGNVLFVADRFYPSSKLCSQCNSKKEDLKLSDRIYECPNCGLKMDRDLNASINLKKLCEVKSIERPARPNLLTVEATALDQLVDLVSPTSVDESVSKQQNYMSRFA